MATVSLICNNTHDNSMTNAQLLKQLHSTNTENIILKQKISTLNALCEHHKSQYHQMKAQLQIEYNQEKDKYTIQIGKLLERNKNQKDKIDKLQTQLTNSQQQSINKSIRHNKQIKLLQNQIETSKIWQQHNVSQTQELYSEIYRLRNESLNKDDHIGKLKARLLSAYDQYIPHYNNYPKSPTLKIKSVRMSMSRSANASPELSANNLKYFNRFHDISPVPSLSNSNVNNYNHTHLRRISNNKKYMKRKWSDAIHNIKPPPIRVYDDEYFDDILSEQRESISINSITIPNLPVLHSLHSNNFGITPITPYNLNQRNSNTKSDRESNVTTPSAASHSSNSLQSVNSSICYIKNSETPMSPDVGINALNEDLEQ